MQTGMITNKNMEAFKPVLLPSVAQGLKRGLPITAIGLLDEGKAVGAVAGFADDGDVFSIASLFVAPDHRRKGGATMLMDALLSTVRAEGIRSSVLSYTEDLKEAKELEKFVKAYGGRESGDLERLYRIPIKSLFQSKYFPKGYECRSVRLFSELSPREKKTARREADKMSLKLRGGALATIRVMDSISVACFRGGHLLGYLCAGTNAKDQLSIAEHCAKNADQAVVTRLFKAFVEACRKEIKPASDLYLPAPDSRYDHLIEELKGAVNLQHNYLF